MLDDKVGDLVLFIDHIYFCSISKNLDTDHSTRVPPLTPQAALPLSVKSRNLLNGHRWETRVSHGCDINTITCINKY